jgi:hypothetical protein
VGFGIRMSTTRYTQGKIKTVKGREFRCNKAGFSCTNRKPSPITKPATPSNKEQGTQKKNRKKGKWQ